MTSSSPEQRSGKVYPAGSVHHFEPDHLEESMKPFSISRRRIAVIPTAALAGVATAALVGAAVASTFTLQVAKNAKIVNANTGAVSHANIVTKSNGFAVYVLTGDSKATPKCTKKNHCFTIWPPVKVRSGMKPSKAPGIKGKLTIWHRDGFNQLLLAGHPLYGYAPDTQKHVATGQDIHSFGGTWHVIKADATAGGGAGGATTGMTTQTMPTGTNPCYPPFCY